MKSSRQQTILELLAEVLLSFLPMVLVMLVLLEQSKLEKVFMKPEWAFSAAIFFGQAVVRLVAATAHQHKSLHAGFLSVVVVLLILLGLAPSCSLVVLVLSSADASSSGPPVGLSPSIQAMQVSLYIVSAIAYVFVGTTARELEHSTNGRAKDNDH